MRTINLREASTGSWYTFKIGEITSYSTAYSFVVDGQSDNMFKKAMQIAQDNGVYYTEFFTETFAAGTISSYPTATRIKIMFYFDQSYNCTVSVNIMEDDSTTLRAFTSILGVSLGDIENIDWRGPLWYTETSYSTGTGYYTGVGNIFGYMNPGTYTSQTLSLNLTYYSDSVYYDELVPALAGLSAPTNPDVATSTDITYPTTPTTDFAGMLTIYNPTEAELTTLSQILWSNNFFVDIYKIATSPLSSVVKLSYLPVKPEVEANKVHPVIGNLIAAAGQSLGVDLYMNRVSSRFQSFDFGTLQIGSKGNFTDYEPYTKVRIYLPFCGTFDLRADEVIGGTIQVKYNIDIATGECVALIKITKTFEDDSYINSVAYTFSGTVNADVPLSANDYTTLISAGRTVAATGSAIAYGAKQGEALMTAGKQVAAADGPVGLVAGGLAGAAVGITASVAMAAASKTEFPRSGALSGNAGYCSVRYPYLIITRQNVVTPDNAAAYLGKPSGMIKTVGDMSGYVKMGSIISNGVSGTLEERNMITRKLLEGVIV